MKTYNSQKHFDIDLCLEKNKAYFEDYDFSDKLTANTLDILQHNFESITFDRCVFSDLDLSSKQINSKIAFLNYTFKKNTSFNNAVFIKDAFFDSSTFIWIADFSNALFNSNASFVKIIAKSDTTSYYSNTISFEKAKFESEVSFLSRKFNDNLSFRSAEFHNKFWFTDCVLGLKANFHNVIFKCDGFADIDICYRILADALRLTGSANRHAQHIDTLEAKAFAQAQIKGSAQS